MLEITVRRGEKEFTRLIPREQTEAPAPEEPDAQTAQAGDSFRLSSSDQEVQSLFDRMEEARVRAEELRERFTIRKNTDYGAVSLAACARLAKARTQADVGAASGYARRQVFRLKAAMEQDGDSAERIKAAIAQLEKVVVRAGRKKKDLAREELLTRRQEKAQEETRRREALRLKGELQRRKSARLVREGGYLKEAAVDDWMQAQRAVARAEYQLRAQEFSPPAAAPISAAQQYAAAVQPPAGEPAGGLDVQV